MDDCHLNGDVLDSFTVYYTLNSYLGWFMWNKTSKMHLLTHWRPEVGLCPVYFTKKSNTHSNLAACYIFLSAWYLFLLRGSSRFSVTLSCSFFQPEVWNTPKRSGEEIWGAARSLDQFATGVQKSSGWQSLIQWSGWHTGQFNERSLVICGSTTLDWIKSTCIFFFVWNTFVFHV